MFKFGAEAPAREKAEELKLFYGWSVFALGWWFVGTEEELKGIGVVEPKSARPQES
jgi:hypothetical protein